LADRATKSRFERALIPHLDAAHNLARWLVGGAPDAEDVVQEACVRALTFFDGFHGTDGRAWLLAIVRNAAYDWLRKRRRQTDAEAHVEPDALPSAERLRHVDRRMVQQGMERLPAEYREILVLREFEGLSYQQLAEVTGAPIGTVMSRLSRARDRLAKEIGK
jgi:RNA polymerase sigma-70 factor (ECF subfamily)